MNGIIVNINPVMFTLGNLVITWYSVMVTLAIIAAIVIAIFEARRKRISAEEIISLAPWVIAGGVIGARLFHVIDRWELYAGAPLHILMIQHGGLAIWGGVAGGAIAVLAYARRKRLSIGRLADTLVPGLLVAQIIGRFACLINGDSYGSATTLPWGFIYINPASMIPENLFGVPTHPYPVYEMLWNLMGLALALKFRRYLKTDGLLFLSYLSFYGVGRFILTFIRHEKIWIWGLQEAQVIAIVILLASLAAIVFLYQRSLYQRSKVGLNPDVSS